MPTSLPAANVSGPTESGPDPDSSTLDRALVLGVLAIALVIRLMHLSSAMTSPLTYQPGTDEDYYQRFGQAVASGHGANSPEFMFMDPAYGYLLGGIFKLAGVNLFAVYLLQVLLDTVTVYGILTVGRVLGRQRAGLFGAALYGICSIPIEFCTTLLKEIWVSAFMTWWVVGALLLLRSKRKWGWLLFGAYCGLGVELRSTLLCMGVLTVMLPLLARRLRLTEQGQGPIKAVLAACGLILTLIPWALRNDSAYGNWSPLSYNGGIVLHQIYNDDNPSTNMWIPAFVNYSHPSEIWRGYAAEAQRRAGKPLSPAEVDRYWRHEAFGFIQRHPGQVVGDMLHKATLWLASTEVPSSRFDAEERMFSPAVRFLPPPGVWLFALGIAGLAWLALDDRRWMIVGVPIGVAWLAVIVFFAESRFRFHAASMLAMCSGIWIEQLLRNLRNLGRWPASLLVASVPVIAIASLALGAMYPPPPIEWDRIVWGYIKMGDTRDAESVVARIAAEQPMNGAIIEAQGYIAASQKRYAEAAADLERAVALRPRSHLAHYNLARVYLELGDRTRAASEAKTAEELNPSPDYHALVSQLSRDR